MSKYVFKRILMLLPVLIGVSLISFSCFTWFRGSGGVIGGEDANPEFIKAVRKEYGLDQPFTFNISNSYLM